jgi:phospholipase C
MPKRRLSTLLRAAAILLVPAAHAQAQRAASTHLDHVFVIVLENRGVDHILGDSSRAPFLRQLANTSNVARQYFAIGHPSLPNYLEMMGGSNFGVGGDVFPDWHGRHPDAGLVAPIVDGGTDISVPAAFTGATGGRDVMPARYKGATIGDQLAAAGKTWRAYEEDLPDSGADGVDFSDGIFSNLSAVAPDSVRWLYAVKHDPFVYLASVQEGRGAGNSLQNVAGFGGLRGLYADLRAGTPPELSFIVPNQCHDMHGLADAGIFCARDSTLVQMGDATAKRLVQAIEGSPVWKTGRNAIVITFDENDSALLPNRVPFIVVTNSGGARTASDVPYNHFALLKTLEAAFGLPCLNHACDAGVRVMSDVFGF